MNTLFLAAVAGKNVGMNGLDWAIIAVYMVGLIALSIYLGKGQKSQEDYYLGGRNLPWWAVGLSTMATQSSAISFISVPAFVALEPGGGMRILQSELAVPLAMIFIMIFFIPFFRKLKLISIYEYLEGRFNSATRTFMSAVFLLSRGLATGVAIYASAIVLEVCLGVPIWATILLVGVVTIIYDTIGGMATVVYSDVIQMIVLLVGVLACGFYALKGVGGWSNAIAVLESGRLQALDFGTHGLGDGGRYPFWGFMVGGFFLYASYYGCDQSQAQRELSAPDTDATKYSLMFNGFFRFPLTILYIFMGISVGAFMVANQGFREMVHNAPKLDHMLPLFIKHYLPHGLKALIFAAILAAAMSSLDSALNSLSASTMRDYIERFVIKGASEKKYLLWSKITTVGWGIIITAFAFLFAGAGKNSPVVILINKIGSAFYGPILAAFILGVSTKKITGQGVILGIISGVLFNIILWKFAPTEMFWMWWNFLGCIVTICVAFAASGDIKVSIAPLLILLVARLLNPRIELAWLTWPFISYIVFAYGSFLASKYIKKPDPEKIKKYVIWEDKEILADEVKWIPRYAVLFGYFVLMLAICYYLPAILRHGVKALSLLGLGG